MSASSPTVLWFWLREHRLLWVHATGGDRVDITLWKDHQKRRALSLFPGHGDAMLDLADLGEHCELCATHAGKEIDRVGLDGLAIESEQSVLMSHEWQDGNGGSMGRVHAWRLRNFVGPAKVTIPETSVPTIEVTFAWEHSSAPKSQANLDDDTQFRLSFRSLNGRTPSNGIRFLVYSWHCNRPSDAGKPALQFNVTADMLGLERGYSAFETVSCCGEGQHLVVYADKPVLWKGRTIGSQTWDAESRMQVRWHSDSLEPVVGNAEPSMLALTDADALAYGGQLNATKEMVQALVRLPEVVPPDLMGGLLKDPGAVQTLATLPEPVLRAFFLEVVQAQIPSHDVIHFVRAWLHRPALFHMALLFPELAQEHDGKPLDQWPEFIDPMGRLAPPTMRDSNVREYLGRSGLEELRYWLSMVADGASPEDIWLVRNFHPSLCTHATEVAQCAAVIRRRRLAQQIIDIEFVLPKTPLESLVVSFLAISPEDAAQAAWDQFVRELEKHLSDALEGRRSPWPPGWSEFAMASYQLMHSGQKFEALANLLDVQRQIEAANPSLQPETDTDTPLKLLRLLAAITHQERMERQATLGIALQELVEELRPLMPSLALLDSTTSLADQAVYLLGALQAVVLIPAVVGSPPTWSARTNDLGFLRKLSPFVELMNEVPEIKNLSEFLRTHERELALQLEAPQIRESFQREAGSLENDGIRLGMGASPEAKRIRELCEATPLDMAALKKALRQGRASLQDAEEKQKQWGVFFSGVDGRIVRMLGLGPGFSPAQAMAAMRDGREMLLHEWNSRLIKLDEMATIPPLSEAEALQCAAELTVLRDEMSAPLATPSDDGEYPLEELRRYGILEQRLLAKEHSLSEVRRQWLEQNRGRLNQLIQSVLMSRTTSPPIPMMQLLWIADPSGPEGDLVTRLREAAEAVDRLESRPEPDAAVLLAALRSLTQANEIERRLASLITTRFDSFLLSRINGRFLRLDQALDTRGVRNQFSSMGLEGLRQLLPQQAGYDHLKPFLAWRHATGGSQPPPGLGDLDWRLLRPLLQEFNLVPDDPPFPVVSLTVSALATCLTGQ